MLFHLYNITVLSRYLGGYMKKLVSAALCLILLLGTVIPTGFAVADGAVATGLSLSVPDDASTSMTIGDTVLLRAEIAPRRRPVRL